MAVITFLLFLAIPVLLVASMWGIFRKAGRSGWVALVPFYNMYVLLKVVQKPGWYLVFWLIPYVGGIIYVIVCVELADDFDRSGWFGVGLVTLTPIFAPILGFGGSKYTLANAPQPAAEFGVSQTRVNW